MVTTIIFLVAYAVVYFDLRVRNEATDLKEMVEKFQQPIENKDENKIDE